MPEEEKRPEFQPNRETVQLAFIHELFRFLRWASVSLAVVVGLYVVVSGVTEVLTDDKPPLVQIVAIVIAFLTGLLGSQTPMYNKLRKFRVYISSHSKRLIALETKSDDKRTSSGIKHDGTHPFD